MVTARPLCAACGGADCPAAGAEYVDDCPHWQEAEARRARGEYLTVNADAEARWSAIEGADD
jgi:hypothetical protein